MSYLNLAGIGRQRKIGVPKVGSGRKTGTAKLASDLFIFQFNLRVHGIGELTVCWLNHRVTQRETPASKLVSVVSYWQRLDIMRIGGST